MDCENGWKFKENSDFFQFWYGLRGPAGPAGPPGRDVQLRGPVATVYDLPVTAPASELWQVGTESPYNGYFFNGTSWVNLGPVAAGATFTPTVSSDGVISWTNDGGLPNPESVNIKGPAGPQGETGPAGPGVPSGGSTRQVLKKLSAADYNTAWQDDDLYITGASVGDLVRINAIGGNGNPLVFGRISDPNKNIGIVQNGNTATQNITKGQYVIWKGALYTASAAIASGTTLSDSNLTAVTDGGLNDVDGKLSALRNAAVTTVVIRWDTDLSAQTVNLNNGLYLVAVDSRNSATDESTGLYIVQSNAAYNSHVTTVRQPTAPRALISIAAGVLTVAPQSSYGFAAIAKLIN